MSPSSIQVHFRSSVATIIGNQLCPTSWMETEATVYSSCFVTTPSARGRPPQKAIIGYSMPNTGPFTLRATGYGYSNAMRPYTVIVVAMALVLTVLQSGIASRGYAEWSSIVRFGLDAYR